MRKLLQWMSTPDDIINKVALDVMRENEGVIVQQHKALLPTFETVPLPESARKLQEWAGGDVDKNLMKIFEYMKERNLYMDDTEYYWTPELAYRDRLIIPFYYEGRVVGWTGRSVQADKKPKYLTEVQPGFVYGLDEQSYNKAFTIVCEGQIDAIHIEGCALGGSEVSDQQAMLLKKLQKQIIIVPDRDTAGSKLIQTAIDHGWSVSMPEWSQDIKDVSEAVNKYGRLYTLYSIVNGAEESALKIKLRQKKWFI
jgi:5S rRNA maturation endonuclease (ribonuclease M5)